MKAFFASVPLELKLTQADGSVLPDTAIIPNFIPEDQANKVFEALSAFPDCDPDTPLSFGMEGNQEPSGKNPRWVTGKSRELKYRGNPLKRDKMWFQRDMTRFLKYGYTGWQWKVSAGTYLLSTVPKLEQLVNKQNERKDELRGPQPLDRDPLQGGKGQHRDAL